VAQAIPSPCRSALGPTNRATRRLPPDAGTSRDRGAEAGPCSMAAFLGLIAQCLPPAALHFPDWAKPAWFDRSKSARQAAAAAGRATRRKPNQTQPFRPPRFGARSVSQVPSGLL